MIKKKICPICKGTGFVIEVVNGVEYAKLCKCRLSDRFLTKNEKANIPPRFIGAELEWYKPEDGNESQIRAKERIKRFINDFPAVTKGLLLMGPTGVGKTRLLSSIATELFKKTPQLDVFYVDWNDLVREMKSGEDYSTRDYDGINQMIMRLIDVDLLLFDELGGSSVSAWVYDNIYYLLNKRYNNNKITVCATNYFDSTDVLKTTLSDRIGVRLRSRLYEMTEIIEIYGNDYRKKNG